MDFFERYSDAFTGGLIGIIAAILLKNRQIRPMPGDVNIQDFRGQADEKLKRRESQSGNSFFRKNPRKVSDIDSIVLHQMGFQRGSDPEKYLGVPAHFIVLPDGTIARLHDFSRYLYTSNGLNSRSIGVEIAGNFPNVNGTWWKPEKFGMDRPTPEQIEAVKSLIRAVKAELDAQGVKLRKVFAHRQSSGTKANDPGPDIWRGVFPVFSELGLDEAGSFHTGTGKPIPESWVP